jgi:hypothetical protein
VLEPSPRLIALKALTAHLEQITTAEGFSFDLLQKVFRGRAIFGEEAPKLMLAILEPPRPDLGIWAGGNQARKEDWPLLLQGTAVDDPENPGDVLYELMWQVEIQLSKINAVDNGGMPLYPEAYLLGRTVTDFQMGPGVVTAPADLTQRAFFYLPLRVGIATTF